MKLALSGVVALLVLCAASGCSTEASDPRVEPTSLPTQAPSAVDPSTPSELPAWHEKFTAEQIDAYEAALSRWQEYTELRNEIYRSGRDTPEARAVLREYSMQWQLRARELAEVYDAGGVRIVTPETPLSWQPISIETDVVVIRQCTDYRGIVVTQLGKPVGGTKPDNVITPLRIEMDKPRGRDWMVASVQLKDQKPCTP